MRAIQSSTTAVNKGYGGWCRTKQFAALRYVSRHLEGSAPGSEEHMLQETGWSVPAGFAETGTRPADAPQWEGNGFSDEAEEMETVALQRDAGELLRAMRYCQHKLAGGDLSVEQRAGYAAELASLRERSWSLMERFMLALRRREESAGPRAVRLERGAAGWIAC